MDAEASERIERAIRQDGRYAPEAYEFLHRGLEFSTREIHGDEPEQGPHHVSGPQLCEGLRELALEQWGPLAREVLARWNIHRTRDFGEMVFLLIGLGMMGKQDSDRAQDFDDVYGFDEAFGSYRFRLDELDQ